jgi:glycosyltransferase involved in cell wall biosynthesis
MISLEKVTIVLATYKPNLNYFRKQLDSLNNQNYNHIDLIVCDDSQDENQSNIVKKELCSRITNFPYRFISNKKNIGSNRTFEKLTLLADGNYIAYCDQDDIWETDKITKLVNKIKEENGVICYSDLAIINDQDIVTAPSLKNISKRLKHVFGERQYKHFIRRNSITGCTMLINTNIAKESLPFPSYDEYVHDHWLALFASCKGNVSYVNEPLIRYRIHANNQIGASILPGITTREDYLTQKLLKEKKRIDFLNCKELKKIDIEIFKEVEKINCFINDRINFFKYRSVKNTFLFLKNIKIDPILVMFEFFINILPYYWSSKLINKVKS